jgi:PAS domain S-box-containing protein
MALRTAQKISLAIGSAAALAVAIAVVSVITARRLRDDVALVTHTHDVREELQRVSRNVDGAKADIRGFLLTGDSTYLTRHAQSIAATESAFKRSTELVADNGLQVERLKALRGLLNAREDALQQTIDLGFAPGRMVTPISQRLAIGEAIAKQIDSTLAIADSEEARLLIDRTHRQDATARLLLGALTALILTAIALVALLWRSIARDLTGRQLAEAELRASEAMFSGILDIGVDAIVTVDAEQRIVVFNRGAEAIFGYGRDEVLGQSLNLLLPMRNRAAHPAHMAAFAMAPETSRRMGERREIHGRRKNGEEFPAEASISKLMTPQGWLFTAVLRDVTERKRQEHFEQALVAASAQLAQSLDYSATLAVAAELPVPTLGVWSVLTLVEPGEGDEPPLRRIAATSADPMMAKALREWASFSVDWDSPEPVIDALRTGNVYRVERVDEDWLEGHYLTAREIDVARQLGMQSLLIVPLRSRDHTIGAWTIGSAIGRGFDQHDDALAVALAERAALAIENSRLFVAAREASAARDQVLGIVSHDLRNPLSAIGMHARRIADNSATNDEREAIASNILSAVHWMHRLIRDLLDVTSIEAGRLSIEAEPQSVQKIIADAVNLVGGQARAREIALTTDVAPDLPSVIVDGARITQVLGNLLSNAVKFTPAGGAIIIKAKRSDGEVMISVQDTGPGIPAAEIDRVFDRFWHARRTSELRGTGLGLAIAQGIVRAHGGRIWVESTPGKGSTFTFTLPS